MTLAVVGSTATAGAARIASLNLCTDSMVLELLPKSQIATVTRLAADPSSSALSMRTAALYLNHGLAEEIVTLAPTMVVSTDAAAGANALLSRLGFRVEIFPSPATLARFRENFVRMGEITATRDRARALLDTMEARLVTNTRPVKGARNALLIEAGGYVPGPGVLADDLIAAAGLRNAAADYQLQQGGFLTVEQLVNHPPAWLLIGEHDPKHPALASDFLSHPAIHRALRDKTRTVMVPAALWTCGGTYFADAVERLRAALVVTP